MVSIQFITTQEEALIATCAQLKFASTPWTTLGSTYEQCLHSFYGDYKKILVAFDKNIVAGFLVLQTYGSFKGYIQTVCVAETFKRQSIATKLMQYAEEYIFKEVSPHMFICVSTFNNAALSLYKKLDYQEIGILKNYIVAGYDEMLMKKSISSYKDFEGKI
jgi:[ribosomal protein S18]-alanine N-acetyltransferase